MKTTYRLHTCKTFMKNTYLIKKDKFGLDIFVILNDKNIKIATTHKKKVNLKDAVNFIKSIENYISTSNKVRCLSSIDFDMDLYMESNKRWRYLTEQQGSWHSFRFINTEHENTIGINYKEKCPSLLMWAS